MLTPRPASERPGARARDYLTTVPPAALHSSAVFLTQPWPLQEFWALQVLLAVAQSDEPLQLLTPAHLTVPSSAACTVVERLAPMANRAAAADAMATPDLIWFSMMVVPGSEKVGRRVQQGCRHRVG